MTDEPNEILATAAAAKAHEQASRDNKEAARQRRRQVGKVGLGVGIGSAAIAAAMLFARRDRTPQKPAQPRQSST